MPIASGLGASVAHELTQQVQLVCRRTWNGYRWVRTCYETAPRYYYDSGPATIMVHQASIMILVAEGFITTSVIMAIAATIMVITTTTDIWSPRGMKVAARVPERHPRC